MQGFFGKKIILLLLLPHMRDFLADPPALVGNIYFGFSSPSTRNNVIFVAGLTFDIGLFHFFVFLPLLCDIQSLVMWHLVMTPPTLVGIPHSGFLSPSLDRGIPTQVEAGTKHDVIAWINNNGSVMMWFWRKLPQIYVRSKLVFSS